MAEVIKGYLKLSLCKIGVLIEKGKATDGFNTHQVFYWQWVNGSRKSRRPEGKGIY
jgi:hypothetical protein